MNQTFRHATRDDIVMSIHILWERGWQVTPESIQESLRIGSHADSSLERIEAIMKDVVSPEAKRQWLKGFNPESPWNKAHPAPWDIPSHWKHQQAERSK